VTIKKNQVVLGDTIYYKNKQGDNIKAVVMDDYYTIAKEDKIVHKFILMVIEKNKTRTKYFTTESGYLYTTGRIIKKVSAKLRQKFISNKEYRKNKFMVALGVSTYENI
jgi:hypothetical protein